MKKLNNKGFTMIEVLVVIVILAIVTAITVPAVLGYYDTAREQSETIFIDRIKSSVDEYLTLNALSYTFDTSRAVARINKCENISDDAELTCNNNVAVYALQNQNVTLQDLIDEGILTENEIVNPNDEDNLCYPSGGSFSSVTINIYRDEDYVYYFDLTLPCLSEGKQLITNHSSFTVS